MKSEEKGSRRHKGASILFCFASYRFGWFVETSQPLFTTSDALPDDGSNETKLAAAISPQVRQGPLFDVLQGDSNRHGDLRYGRVDAYRYPPASGGSTPVLTEP